MPTVRTYGPTHVDLAPVPGVRRTAAETPESEGAGLDLANARKDAVAGDALGSPLERLGTTAYAQLQDEERKNADETAILAASNQLSAWKNTTLYDPTKGAFTKKGSDAFPLPEQIHDSFTKAAGDIADTLSTPEQQKAFAKLSTDEWQNVDLQVRRHVFGEMQEYKASELKGVVANATDDAIRNAEDPALIDANLGKAVGAIREAGPRLGLAPEQVDSQVRAATSDIHVGVIRNLLAGEQDTKAAIYFDQHKDAIAATQLDDVQKALDIGATRGQSQKIADQILQAGGSLDAQLAKIKDLDPKIRDAVQERLEHADSITQRAAREAEEGTMRQAYNILDQTPDVTKIPPAMWATFTGPTRAAMFLYAKARTEGTPIKTDPPTYYKLMLLAGDKPQDFALTNLLPYKARLDDADFKQLAETQKAIKNGDRAKADRNLGDFRTNAEMINSSLTQYGIDTKATDTGTINAIAELHRMVGQQVQIKADQTGKKPTDSDVQGIIDTILSTSTKVPGSWWGLVPFSGRSLLDKSKAAILTQVGDISADQRTIIERQLRAAGVAVSDATVLDAYITLQTKKPK